MKKKRSKGFMLVELIVTSTIIVATMIGLYASFTKIYTIYQTKNNYYHIDGIYATKEMTKNITVPMDEQTKLDLTAGDYVYLTGTIYTARDAAHKRF